ITPPSTQEFKDTFPIYFDDFIEGSVIVYHNNQTLDQADITSSNNNRLNLHPKYTA
ncbi:14777_t:CDS:1, partial [Acaulospora colombiana]